jgi:hypothetical protein
MSEWKIGSAIIFFGNVMPFMGCKTDKTGLQCAHTELGNVIGMLFRWGRFSMLFIEQCTKFDRLPCFNLCKYTYMYVPLSFMVQCGM